MKKTFNIVKQFSFINTEVLLGNFLSSYVFKIDIIIENPFNTAILKIGTNTAPESILNYNISNKITSISLDNIGLINENIYLKIEGIPNTGNGTITIYYLDSSSFILKTITYQDFVNLNYTLGTISSGNRLSDIIFEVTQIFDKGTVELLQENTSIIGSNKIDLTKLRKYLFEYHEEHLPLIPFTLHFEDHPSKGELQIILLYFPLKG